MKRLALRTTAAVAALALSALGSTASAMSGYVISWAKSGPAPTVQTERASSGYLVTWSKGEQTERVSSGYLVSWSRSGYTVAWTKAQSAE